jgi:hypothetical protein
MILLRAFEYTCRKGHTFRSPGAAESYGTLIARSRRPQSERLVRTFDDPIHDELESLLRKVAPNWSDKAIDDVHQLALSVVLDHDIDGSEFVVGGSPVCPVCATDKIDAWQSVEPPVIWEDDLPFVDHVRWDGMAEAEKIGLLKSFLETYDES